MAVLPLHAESFLEETTNIARKFVDAVLAAIQAAAATPTPAQVPQLVTTFMPTLDRILPPPPSDYVATGELPPIVESYAPTLRTLEAQRLAALRAVCTEYVPMLVINDLMGRVRAGEFAAAPRLDAKLREALAPSNVQEWGTAAAREKAQPYVIPFDGAAFRDQLNKAILDELIARTGIRASGTLFEWLGARRAAFDAANAEWHNTAANFTRVYQLLMRNSQDETDTGVRYDRIMADIVGTLQTQWTAALAAATSMADLQTRITPALVGALQHADDAAASYRAAIPLFSAADRVPDAPLAHTPAELFRTPNGVVVAALVPIVRRIVPLKLISDIEFVKTLPPSVLAVPTTTAQWHVLDPLQAWMAQNGAPNTGPAYANVKQRG